MQQLQNLPTINEIDEQLRILRDRKITRAREKYCYYMEFIYNGHWKKARHLELLCNLLESVEIGELSRLIITMPPRHGKSMTVTESFPSWFIGRNPERRVIEVSYGSELAQRFGLANRRKIDEFGEEIFNIKVSSENASKTNCGIENYSGGMISAGIGGSIRTGS